MNRGYVKLFRSSLDSPVFQNDGLWKVWSWCLLKAAHKNVSFSVTTGRGATIVELQTGQFIFGRKTAALELQMNESTVYKRMKILEKLKNLTIQSNSHYSIISITNWNGYQVVPEESNRECNTQVTGKYQASNTYKNDKNVKNLKNNTLSDNPDISPGKTKKQPIPFDEVVDYLNQKTSKSFRSCSKGTQSHIRARFAEGYTMADFITVIDRKTAKWGSDPKMADYLRPETLFGPKFEGYLNESAEPAATSNGMREFRADDPSFNANTERG